MRDKVLNLVKNITWKINIDKLCLECENEELYNILPSNYYLSYDILVDTNLEKFGYFVLIYNCNDNNLENLKEMIDKNNFKIDKTDLLDKLQIRYEYLDYIEDLFLRDNKSENIKEISESKVITFYNGLIFED